MTPGLVFVALGMALAPDYGRAVGVWILTATSRVSVSCFSKRP